MADDTSSMGDAGLGRTLRRALDVASCVPVRLEGVSMAPLIVPGTTATLLRCSLHSLRTGDVAVYVRGEQVVAHLVKHIDAAGPRPSALGRRELEPAITAEVLLGRLKGTVIRRSSFPRAPRALARSIALGVAFAVEMRRAL